MEFPHLVACERMVGSQESCLGDDIEVGERWLDHEDVGTFLDVSDLSGVGQSSVDQVRCCCSRWRAWRVLGRSEAAGSTSCYQSRAQIQQLPYRAQQRLIHYLDDEEGE